jgi:hypothetical protein
MTIFDWNGSGIYLLLSLPLSTVCGPRGSHDGTAIRWSCPCRTDRTTDPVNSMRKATLRRNVAAMIIEIIIMISGRHPRTVRTQLRLLFDPSHGECFASLCEPAPQRVQIGRSSFFGFEQDRARAETFDRVRIEPLRRLAPQRGDTI